MNLALDVVLIVHFVGLAAIIGSWLATMKDPRITVGFLHGSIVQVVTGILLVALREMQDLPVDHMKIGIKLVVAVAILVISIIGLRKEKSSAGSTAVLAHAAGALAVVNVAIAVLL